MSSNKRTGTQLLLDLETKVEALMGHVRNLENTAKIILQRINDSPSSQPSVEPQAISMAQIKRQAATAVAPAEPPKTGEWAKFEDLPRTNKFAEARTRAGVADDPAQQAPMKARPAAAPPPPDEEELREEVVHKGARRGLRVPASQGPKVTVSQQVFTAEGRPVFLASVEALDERGQLARQTRTNRNGRWVMGLEPGQYTIHVVKRVAPDSGKEPVELTYPVTIPPSNEEMELDPPEIG
jgi:hypothetical protein